MGNPNDVIEKMVDKAIERVSEKGSGATQKEITLATYGMLSRQIKSRMDCIAKPLKWMAGIVATAVAWYVVSGVFGL